MKKIISYILIVLTIGQIFAPFSFNVDKKEKSFKFEKTIAAAEDNWNLADLGISIETTSYTTDSSIRLEITVNWSTSPNLVLTNEKVYARIETPSGYRLQEFDLSPRGKTTQKGNLTFNKLDPETTYKIYLSATQNTVGVFDAIANSIKDLLLLDEAGEWTGLDNLPFVGNVLFKKNGASGTVTNEDNPYEITTLESGNTSIEVFKQDTVQNEVSILPTCDLLDSSTWGGCIGRFVYWLFFKPSSVLFALTGRLLDISIDYSIKDSSYESEFVVEGWGVVRDFCNMFFIFILLYIAFGTILSLNGVKTKEMIINVILIGLFINFSLFATQVIIDASNILTRVFYNSQTIKVGPKINGVVQDERGSQGEIKLSEAIVEKIKPHKLILEAEKTSIIKTKQTMSENDNKTGSISATTFILVTILASVVNIVGLFVFLSVSILFIARVIGLWLAMIFAPLAFFSYIVPSMQSWGVVGWKNWWPETLKLAFLAPIFMFFLYLIIKFLETGLGLVINDNESGLDFILGIIIPFVFIMILLMKAKGIAKDMSGQIGQTLLKVGGKAGGMVVGAGLAVATGGAAMAMRGTLGRAGAALQNSGTLKDAEAKGGIKGWGAKQLRNIGGASAKSSFDARATKIGSSAIAGMGSALGTKITAGKPKAGGYEKSFNDKVTAKQKRAEELQVGKGEPLQKALNKSEDDLQKLLSENKSIIDDLDKKIEKARENLRDAKSSNDQTGINKYAEHLKVYKEQKNALLNGGSINKTIQGDNGPEQIQADYSATKNNGFTIKELEDKVKEDKKKISNENRERRNNYANSRERRGGPANREAAHRIRMESKLDSGEKGK